MSVEQTLAERGARYGDFTDHAEICQRLKLAMLAGSARWTRLSDVQKQALEVIADKIARILSGDPNYADNWHDIQGYAKLVEDRLSKPKFSAAARVAELNAEIQTLIADDACPGCGYPADAAGTHYATCSKLTAPKEFVDQVEQVFDELESTEPAAEIDDESPRAQAIGQNGNDGAVYDDPWFGAPEWARWKAQDASGKWWWYSDKPTRTRRSDFWQRGDASADHTDAAGAGEPNPNWRDTLIQRP